MKCLFICNDELTERERLYLKLSVNAGFHSSIVDANLSQPKASIQDVARFFFLWYIFQERDLTDPLTISEAQIRQFMAFM